MSKPTPDKRTEIYFFDFDVDKKDGTITAKGVQFVTQVVPPPNDMASFSTLKKGDDDGHMKNLRRCLPEHSIIKELAALPDKIGRDELVRRVMQWRSDAKQLLK